MHTSPRNRRSVLLPLVPLCLLYVLAISQLGFAGGGPYPGPEAFIQEGFWGSIDAYSYHLKTNNETVDCPYAESPKAFAGMNKDSLPKAGAAYRNKYFDDAIEILEDRLKEPLDDRLREEAELLMAKCYLRKVHVDVRYTYNVRPREIARKDPDVDPLFLDEAEKRFKAFLRTAKDPYFIREANGWMAHVDWLRGRSAKAARYYMDQLLDPCSIFSQGSLEGSLSECIYLGMSSEFLDPMLDSPGRVLVLLHMSTSWFFKSEWGNTEHNEFTRKLVEIAAGKPELFTSGSRSAELALALMKTALFQGDVKRALLFSEYLGKPISADLIPEIMWIRACCHVLDGHLDLAEKDLLTMRDAAGSDTDAKKQALIGLMSLYYKQDKPVELLHFATQYYVDNDGVNLLDDASIYSFSNLGGGLFGVFMPVQDFSSIANIHLSTSQLQGYLSHYGDGISQTLRNQLSLALAIRLVCDGKYDEAIPMLEELREAPAIRVWSKLPADLARLVLTKEIYDAYMPCAETKDAAPVGDNQDTRSHAGHLLLEVTEFADDTTVGRIGVAVAKSTLQNDSVMCAKEPDTPAPPPEEEVFPKVVAEPTPPPKPLEPVDRSGIGDVLATSNNGRYRLFAPWIIWDTTTNLEWYPVDDVLDWEKAKSFAKEFKEYGGGWRLPIHKELKAFATKEQCYPIHGLAYLTPLVARYMNMDSRGERTCLDHSPCGWVWSAEERDADSLWGFDYLRGESSWAERDQKRMVFLVRPYLDAPSRANATTTPRYVKLESGVVVDMKTNLEWFPWEEYKDWAKTKNWAANLSVDGGGWRMPTLKELSYFATQKQRDSVFHGDYLTSLIDEEWGFRYEVWSADSDAPPSAWAFDFYYGQPIEISPHDPQLIGRGLAVRTRRDDTKPLPTLSREDGLLTAAQCNASSNNGRFIRKQSGVIVDLQRDLEWYPSPDFDSYSWYKAKSWVTGLDVDGGSWRLPTLEELQRFSRHKQRTPSGMCYRTPFVPWADCRTAWAANGKTFDFWRDVEHSFSYTGMTSTPRVLAVRPRNLITDAELSAQTAGFISDKTTPTAPATAPRHAGADSTAPKRSYMAVNNSFPGERFTADTQGIITDAKTGLQWFVGPDESMEFSDARRWADALLIEGGGWRIPTGYELRSLVLEKNQDRRCRFDPLFDRHPSLKTLDPPECAEVWAQWQYYPGFRYVSFDTGEEYVRYDPDFHAARVFAVRVPTIPMDKPNLTEDKRFVHKELDVVQDSWTGLEWYRCSTKRSLDWDKTRDLVADLIVDGFGGWRMPSMAELQSITREEKGGLGREGALLVFGPLPKFQYYIWSSDEDQTTLAGYYDYYSRYERWRTWDNQRRDHVLAVRAAPHDAQEGQFSDQNTTEAFLTSDGGRFIKQPSGVILDTTTHLEWYPSPAPETLSRKQAIRWAAELSVNGSGWRLPTMDELKGFATKEPHEPGGHCHRTPLIDWPSCYEVRAGDERKRSFAWRYYADDGKWDLSNKILSSAMILAVRTPPPVSQDKEAKPARLWPIEQAASRKGDSRRIRACNATDTDTDRFERTKDSVILDTKTGLEWYPGVDANYSWPQATRWAAGLDVDGDGWRLPDKEELRTIALDTPPTPEPSLPCLPAPIAKQWERGSIVWTSGTYRDHAWILPFSSGNGTWINNSKTRHARALAVRQQQDPPSGTR